MEEIEEEDEDDEDGQVASAKETDALRKRRGKFSLSTASGGAGETSSQQGHKLSGLASGAQNITQRLLEKNRARQAKKKEFRKAYDLKLAYSEFYLSLILLQNYQSLNSTGFKKILKKHDKVWK